MHCNCEKAQTENKTVGARCSCSKSLLLTSTYRAYPIVTSYTNAYDRPTPGRCLHMLPRLTRELQARWLDLCLWQEVGWYVHFLPAIDWDMC